MIARWFGRSGDDSTWKNKSRISSKGFSSSRKSNLIKFKNGICEFGYQYQLVIELNNQQKVILHARISEKCWIKLFRLRSCFQENSLIHERLINFEFLFSQKWNVLWQNFTLHFLLTFTDTIIFHLLFDSIRFEMNKVQVHLINIQSSISRKRSLK